MKHYVQIGVKYIHFIFIFCMIYDVILTDFLIFLFLISVCMVVRERKKLKA